MSLTEHERKVWFHRKRWTGPAIVWHHADGLDLPLPQVIELTDPRYFVRLTTLLTQSGIRLPVDAVTEILPFFQKVPVVGYANQPFFLAVPVAYTQQVQCIVADHRQELLELRYRCFPSVRPKASHVQGVTLAKVTP